MDYLQLKSNKSNLSPPAFKENKNKLTTKTNVANVVYKSKARLIYQNSSTTKVKPHCS